MADQKVGGVYYEVAADVQQVIDAEDKVYKSTQEMKKDFEKVDGAVRDFITTITTAGLSIDKAGKVVDKFGVENKQLTATLNDLAKTQGRVGTQIQATEQQYAKLSKTSEAVQSSFGGLRGVAGNLGFQLQDIAVQAQAGTSAFVILGQQGSQLASAFGPGGAVLGAVIAVAAAIGGVLFTSLKETSAEIKDKFNPSIDDMKEKMDELTKAQAEFAIIQLRKDMEPLASVARSTAAQVEYLTKQIQKYPSNKDVKQWNEELVRQQAILDGVNQQIERNQSDLKAYEDIVKRNIAGTQGQQKSEKERADALADLIKQTTTYAQTVGLNARDLALYAAKQNKATQADIDTINALFDTIEAYELKKESVRKATAEQKEYLKSVEDTMLAELKAEQDTRKTVTTEFQQVATSAATDLESPAQRAERELAERLAVINRYAQQEYADKEAALQAQLDAEQAYSDKIKTIKHAEDQFRSQQNMNTLSAVGDFFGNLASIAEKGGEKQFKAWKLLASAQAGISAALAVLAVLADQSIQPTGLRIGLAGSMAALAGAQIAQIQSAQYSGGRMYGGPVSPGNVYQVGENNSPELLQQGNKQYLIPGNRGSVTSNADMMGGGMNVSVNVQNYSGQPVDVQRGQTGSGTNAQEVINIVVGNINQRGQIHQSIVRSTTAGNRTT